MHECAHPASSDANEDVRGEGEQEDEKAELLGARQHGSHLAASRC
jgi:hypothetical protein